MYWNELNLIPNEIQKKWILNKKILKCNVFETKWLQIQWIRNEMKSTPNEFETKCICKLMYSNWNKSNMKWIINVMILTLNLTIS